ncbi:MAG: nicotinamide riboside transporter PnuC [Candidatus Azobacteroides pseudotrichonymphae]|jgi:nicotinamide mononucleotide transporter|nr:nicotinamide riboside transporter PnuC [Bacteroidales bacterium OttesenSCG-928-I14]GMO35884.1 MAG: nicotinamide riboside transporter PnuC [Candidatus Azobacteroides pseudotrichonymphae]
MIYEIINWGIVLWFIENWVELVGVVLTLVMLYLGIMCKWTVWIISIISSLFYVYINFTKELYALAGLCFYNAVMSFYGLYCWKFIKTKNNQDHSFCLITKKMLLKLIPVGIASGVIVFFFILFIIGRISFFSVLETFITTLSIITIWMTVRKIVESWLLWIISDVCSVILYLYKEMYPSAFLYVVYTVFAIFGYIFWRKKAVKGL